MFQEDSIRLQYAAHLAAFRKAFPNIAPPDADWWALWIDKYSPNSIQDAIEKLAQHPLKHQFTQESTGKAITSLLRQSALRRAFSDPSGGAR